ncbi:TPA: hypothetical protein REP68_002331, partial [Staphylococcus pseudintermedius]|nr:hypothetical protein [Staphylococcus pseudintermedius]
FKIENTQIIASNKVKNNIVDCILVNFAPLNKYTTKPIFVMPKTKKSAISPTIVKDETVALSDPNKVRQYKVKITIVDTLKIK